MSTQQKLLLEKFGRDLTDLANNGDLDPVIGREDEINRVIQILSRKTKNNPVLVGKAGVGKTAIAEGLAQNIVENKVPSSLSQSRIIELSLTSLVAGTKFRGELEERLKIIIDELREHDDIIVFIDELHTIVGAGSAQGALDAANMLKPSLARGEVRMIGATTFKEFKTIEKDKALARRFGKVTVNEPSMENMRKIIKRMSHHYEGFHKVAFTEEIQEAILSLSHRYMAYRHFPDKAIDVLDEVGAYVKLRNIKLAPELIELYDELTEVRSQKQIAVTKQEFEEASKLRDKEKRLEVKRELLQARWEDEMEEKVYPAQIHDILDVISKLTNIDRESLSMDDPQKYLNLSEVLKNKVLGQDDAIDLLGDTLMRGKAGLNDPKKPIGSFLFLGPTGVGKTQTVKDLAEYLFGTEEALIRFDMSEYREPHAVANLIGSPPGYIGYEEGGKLTEAVKQKPYSVILFDEIEKAHPDIMNVFLQILDDGILSDKLGVTVNFRNTVIIFTSNLGTGHSSSLNMGFSSKGEKEQKKQDDALFAEHAIKVARKYLKPEVYNRLDNVVVFKSLDKKTQREILLKFIEEKEKQLQGDWSWAFTNGAIDYLIEKGYDKKLGARPLQRVLSREVLTPLAKEILVKSPQKGDRLKIKKSSGKGLTFKWE